MLKAEPELLFYHDPPSDEVLILLNFYSRQSNNSIVTAQMLLKRFSWNKENDLQPQKINNTSFMLFQQKDLPKVWILFWEKFYIILRETLV